MSIQSLPNELLLQILDYVELYEVPSFSGTCRRFQVLAVERMALHKIAQQQYSDITTKPENALGTLLALDQFPGVNRYPSLLCAESSPFTSQTGKSLHPLELQRVDILLRRSSSLSKADVDYWMEQLSSAPNYELVIALLLALLPNITELRIDLVDLRTSVLYLTKMIKGLGENAEEKSQNLSKLRYLFIDGHSRDTESPRVSGKPVQFIAETIALPNLEEMYCKQVTFVGSVRDHSDGHWLCTKDYGYQLFEAYSTNLIYIHLQDCYISWVTLSALLGSAKSLKGFAWYSSNLFCDRDTHKLCRVLSEESGETLEDLCIRSSYEQNRQRPLNHLRWCRHFKLLKRFKVSFWTVQNQGIDYLFEFLPQSIEEIILVYNKLFEDNPCHDTVKFLSNINTTNFSNLPNIKKIQLPDWRWERSSGIPWETSARLYLRSKTSVDAVSVRKLKQLEKLHNVLGNLTSSYDTWKSNGSSIAQNDIV